MVFSGYEECLRRGIKLSYAPIETLVDVNQANQDSWKSFLGIFDYRLGQLHAKNSMCLVGRNNEGEIVYTRAARLFELGGDNEVPNFYQLIQQMLHIYGDASERHDAEESWQVSGGAIDVMKSIDGRVVFSGGVWCHPHYRKQGFTAVASAVGRACAHSAWDNDYTVTFMARSVIDGGHAQRTGYENIAWTVEARNASIGNMDIAFLWINKKDTLEQISNILNHIASGRQPERN